MATDLSADITSNAQGPQSVQGDAGSVQQHSLADQIAADRYLAAKDAAKKSHRGIRITRLIPPGTVGGE